MCTICVVSTRVPLDGVLHLRLSTHEKVLWVQSAGGERLLSRWVRERCNAAVSEGVGDSPERSRVESVGSTPTTAPTPSLTAELCPKREFHGGQVCSECGWKPTVLKPEVAVPVRDVREVTPDWKKKL